MDQKVFEKVLTKALGITFEPSRFEFVKNRLRTIGWREEKLEFANIANILLNPNSSDYHIIVDLLTVHETYFFREFNQLEMFANNILNSYAKSKTDKSIRVLSAGCSTGEEAYTLGIILKECLDNYDDYHVEVVGIDLSMACVRKAQKAQYSKRSVKFTPEIYQKKYFNQGTGLNEVNRNLLPKTIFSQGSIIDESIMRSLGVFDFVFCRNVLIYFEQKERLEILKLFNKNLYPEGRLFLGHSESLLKYPELFESTDTDEIPIYRRAS